MPKKIDWLYHRNSCATCTKAEGYRAEAGAEVKETVIANKTKYGPKEALALLKGMSKLVVVKGTKVMTFDLKKDPPDDAAILALVIGPTGNLRAPTAKVGSTFLVGFNPEAYEQVLGG